MPSPRAGVVQMTKAWRGMGALRHSCQTRSLLDTSKPNSTTFLSGAAGQALIKRIPQRRLGELRELEGPLLLLASKAGSYMTGSVIVATAATWFRPLNGGFLADLNASAKQG